jgi:hypothetical protein
VRSGVEEAVGRVVAAPSWAEAATIGWWLIAASEKFTVVVWSITSSRLSQKAEAVVDGVTIAWVVMVVAEWSMAAPRSRPESRLVVTGRSDICSEAEVAPRTISAVSKVVEVTWFFIRPGKFRIEAVVVVRWFMVTSE